MSAPAPRRMPWQLSVILALLSVECLVMIGVTWQPLTQLPWGWLLHLVLALWLGCFAGYILAIAIGTWQLDLQTDRFIHPVTRGFTTIYAALLLLPGWFWLQPISLLERLGLALVLISALCLFSLSANDRFWRRRVSIH